MACGTPVIGFDAGGIPDYVIPGKTGLLAKNGDAAQLGERLQAAVADPVKMLAMGAQARQLILDHFQAEIEAQSYMNLYRNLIESQDQANRRAA